MRRFCPHFPALLCLALILVPAGVVQAEDPPKGPLNDSEKKFVGKWKGKRDVYVWEIERKADRTFEIAFHEPDPERLLGRLKNYAVGVWWIEGDDYKFEWKKWWGAEGELGGLFMEKVSVMEKDRVITLSEGAEDPRNIEVRVENFRLTGWKLKPEEKAATAAEKEKAPE